jgi:hypothetical protein
MSEIKFEWKREWLTPLLLQAVGGVILNWSRVDHEIIKLCEHVWRVEFPTTRVPRPFNARTTTLLTFARKLYLNEPEEFRIFAWYIQRLRTLNDSRDDVAHGTPGIVTKHGKSSECLMVPFPSRATEFRPITIRQIENLSLKLDALASETSWVSGAVSRAIMASSSGIYRELIDGEWRRLTMYNRTPRLPRDSLPPPSFRA